MTCDYAIGAGVESMTRVPMFSDIGGGYEKLNPEVLKKYDLIHQGESAERIAEKWKITRDEVDQYSAESHRRASAAAAAGSNKEILPTPGIDAEGKSFELKRDEGIRDQTRHGQDEVARHGLSAERQRRGDGGQLEPDFRRCVGDSGRRPRGGSRRWFQAAGPVSRQGGRRRRSDDAAHRRHSRDAQGARTARR